MWIKGRITEVDDEEESSTPLPIRPGRAVVSLTPEVLPLPSPPPSVTTSTLSQSSSPLVSPPPEPVVQGVQIANRKPMEGIEGAAKRTHCVKIPVFFFFFFFYSHVNVLCINRYGDGCRESARKPTGSVLRSPRSRDTRCKTLMDKEPTVNRGSPKRATMVLNKQSP